MASKIRVVIAKPGLDGHDRGAKVLALPRCVLPPYHSPMPILGHGIDIVETSRIKKLAEDHGQHFLDRVFTPLEQQYCARNPKRYYEHLSGRFAADATVSGTFRWRISRRSRLLCDSGKVRIRAATFKPDRSQRRAWKQRSNGSRRTSLRCRVGWRLPGQDDFGLRRSERALGGRLPAARLSAPRRRRKGPRHRAQLPRAAA